MRYIIVTNPKMGRVAINIDKIIYFYAVGSHSVIQFEECSTIAQETMEYIEDSINHMKED